MINVVILEYYFNHFNENFGYRFGKPQVDVYSQYEHLLTKDKTNILNINSKIAAANELKVHKQRAKHFIENLLKSKSSVIRGML